MLVCLHAANLSENRVIERALRKGSVAESFEHATLIKLGEICVEARNSAVAINGVSLDLVTAVEVLNVLKAGAMVDLRSVGNLIARGDEYCTNTVGQGFLDIDIRIF